MHTEKSRAFWPQRHYLCFEKEGRGIQHKEQCSHNETWRKEYYAVRIFFSASGIRNLLKVEGIMNDMWTFWKETSRTFFRHDRARLLHFWWKPTSRRLKLPLLNGLHKALTRISLKMWGVNLRPRPRPEDQYRWRSSKDLPKKKGLVLFRGDMCETC